MNDIWLYELFPQERQGSQVLQDDPAVPELGGAALHHAARRVVRRSSLQGDKDLHLGAKDEHGAALLQPGMFIIQVNGVKLFKLRLVWL